MTTITAPSATYMRRLGDMLLAWEDGVRAGVVAPRGLRATILTGKYNASNDGLSANVDTVTIVGIVDETRRTQQVTGGSVAHRDLIPVDWCHAHVTNQSPPVLLVKRRIGRVCWHVVPADAYTLTGATGPWYMASGAYVTADSRLSDHLDAYAAIALHDRRED